MIYRQTIYFIICIGQNFFIYFSSFSLICYILVVKDLVGLDHDAGDIAGEKVVVFSDSSYTLFDCAKASSSGSRARSVLHDDTLRWLRLLLLCRLHLIELTFRDDD